MPRTPTWDLPVFDPNYRQWQEERNQRYRRWMEQWCAREEEAILRGGPVVPEERLQIRQSVEDRDRLRQAQEIQRIEYQRHLYARGPRYLYWTDEPVTTLENGSPLRWTPLVDESATMRREYLAIPRSWAIPTMAQPMQPSLFELSPPTPVRKTYGTRIERPERPAPVPVRRRNRRNPEFVSRLREAADRLRGTIHFRPPTEEEPFRPGYYRPTEQGYVWAGENSRSSAPVDEPRGTPQADRTPVHVPVHSGEVLGGDQHGERGECPSGGASDMASVSPGRIIPPVREG